MRGSWMVALLMLLPGCSDPPAETDDAEDASQEAPEDGNATASTVLEVQSYAGRFTAAARVPPVLGAPTEEMVGGEPFDFTLGEDVEGLLIEMTWDGDPRADLTVRAVSSGDSYHYGGAGAGTPDDPDSIFIEHPENGYSVVPVADTVAASQDYDVYVTFFSTPELPEGYTAVPQS